MKRTAIAIVMLSLFTGAALAATYPPDQVNYQGVLRDSADKPIDGSREMIFRFYSALTGGDEILIDEHVGGNAITITDGLFNVRLGSGNVSDGSGPGTYTALWAMFKDYGSVHLSIEVGGEVLTPRVPIVSAAYALNADTLAGYSHSDFVDKTADYQWKLGRLDVGPSNDWVARLYSDSSGYQYSVWGRSANGARFDNSSSGSDSVVYLAEPTYGMEVQGSTGAAYFQLPTDRAKTFVAYTDTDNYAYGIHATGNRMGGFFKDGNDNSEMWAAYASQGVHAVGGLTGGKFEDSDGTSRVYVAYGNEGIHATGDDFGVWAKGEVGIRASGSEVGGRFIDTDGSGSAYLAYGDYGIKATGTVAGGSFNIVEITGGKDLAEPFPVRDAMNVPDGTVVVIDEENPGALVPSTMAYDSRVAGIISGAGGLRPGITLTHTTPAADERPVALTGRAYCRATADNGAIRPGDLLTTSDLAGHAMRASDTVLASGAIIGKAMSALDSGEGLVLVLVNLQ